MKTINDLDLSNVVGGLNAAPLPLRQGMATINYNDCLNAAQTKASGATAAASSLVQTGKLAPVDGIAAGVQANRTLRSDNAACDASNPIPTE